MFGNKIDNLITMLQRIVALARDISLIIIALVTAKIIESAGSEPELSTLDWSKFLFTTWLSIFIVIACIAIIFIAVSAIIWILRLGAMKEPYEHTRMMKIIICFFCLLTITASALVIKEFGWMAYQHIQSLISLLPSLTPGGSTTPE